jgi:hypothetical protein
MSRSEVLKNYIQNDKCGINIIIKIIFIANKTLAGKAIQYNTTYISLFLVTFVNTKYRLHITN